MTILLFLSIISLTIFRLFALPFQTELTLLFHRPPCRDFFVLTLMQHIACHETACLVIPLIRFNIDSLQTVVFFISRCGPRKVMLLITSCSFSTSSIPISTLDLDLLETMPKVDEIVP
jgi:hypothetical protein